jgi:hypothetical protein
VCALAKPVSSTAHEKAGCVVVYRDIFEQKLSAIETSGFDYRFLAQMMRSDPAKT